MSKNQSQFRQAQEALRAGRKHEARALLQEVLRADPENYQAWLWLAAVTPSARASLDYVARAERLNPGDPIVSEARAWAEHRLAEAEESKSAPAARTPAAAPDPTAAPATAAGRGRRVRPLLLGGVVLALLLLTAAFVRLQQRENGAGETVAAVATTPGEPTAEPTESARHFMPRTLSDPEEVQPSPTATTVQQVQIATKPVVATEEGTARPTWTVTPSPTPTPTPTPTPVPTFVSNSTAPQPVMRPNGVGPDERWIDVNLTTQTLVAYEGNTPVYESLVSSGTWNHPTVTGQFRIWLRFTSQTMDGRRLGYDYYLENVPYVMYFFEDYALHGTFWHNNFGTPMSHGCVNLPTPAAEWIFNWSEMGTLVNVHY